VSNVVLLTKVSSNIAGAIFKVRNILGPVLKDLHRSGVT
jgi:hypothetical protein